MLLLFFPSSKCNPTGNTLICSYIYIEMLAIVISWYSHKFTLKLKLAHLFPRVDCCDVGLAWKPDRNSGHTPCKKNVPSSQHRSDHAWAALRCCFKHGVYIIYALSFCNWCIPATPYHSTGVGFFARSSLIHNSFMFKNLACIVSRVMLLCNDCAMGIYDTSHGMNVCA